MKKVDERMTASEMLEAAQMYATEAIPRPKGNSRGKLHKDSRVFYGTMS
jgi:hypothetical protein